jgi:hypothetical protein
MLNNGENMCRKLYLFGLGLVLTFSFAFAGVTKAISEDDTQIGRLKTKLENNEKLTPIEKAIVLESRFIEEQATPPSYYNRSSSRDAYLTEGLETQPPGAWIQDHETRTELPLAGGPDAFGYTWVTSFADGGPLYTWIDTTGATDAGIANGDDHRGTIEIPFVFRFYDNLYSRLTVTTNGWIGMGPVTNYSSSSWTNTNLPSEAIPDNIIAPLWDDFKAGGSPGSSNPAHGTILYKTLGAYPNRQFVIIFHEIVRGTSDTDYFSFEVILEEATSDIIIQYADVLGNPLADNGVGATIGIENADASVGLLYGFNGSPNLVYDEMAIQFVAPLPPTVPNVVLSASDLNFGSTYAGAPILTAEVNISNNGSGDLVVSGVTISEPFSSNFSGTIPQYGSATANIYFDPAVVGEFNQTLNFTVSGEFTGETEVALTGSAYAIMTTLNEGFEGNIFPPLNWKVTTTDASGDAWESANDGSTHGPGIVAEGSLAAMADIFNMSSNTTSSLMSPVVDLTSLINPKLSFFWQCMSGTSPQPSLTVNMSDDGGISWTEIYYQEADGSSNEWINVKALLPQVSLTTMFEFVAFSDYGNYNMYLDAVLIEDESTIHIPNDYATIQEGIDAADSSDIVLVQPGTYFENIIWPATNGITLLGAGDTSNTIIDGGGLSSVIYMNPQTATIDTTTLIQGFKITNGGGVLYGGGLYINNASPKIMEITLSNNVTDNGGGGGIYIINSNPILINVTIRNNSSNGGADSMDSFGRGGGVLIEAGCSPRLSNIRVLNNTANYGGGIYQVENSSTAFLSDVIVKNNIVPIGGTYGKGGGLYLNNKVKMINVSVVDNIANEGGGILWFPQESTDTLSNIFVSGNSASGDGGGIRTYGTTSSTIVNSQIIRNTSNGGAGMYLQGISKLSNMLIYDNNATGGPTGSGGYGGGVLIYGGNASIDSTIIASNTGNSDGGGLYKWGGGSISYNFVSIIDNSGVNGGGIYNSSTANLNNVSIINNLSTGTGDGIASGDYYNTGGILTVSNSNIAHNARALINEDNSQYSQALNNYWGHESGPYHPSQNPTGQGDSTNQFVNVTPWLTAPNTDAPPIPAQGVIVSGTGNDFISLAWDPSPLGDFAGYKLYYDSDETGYPYENSIDIGNNTSYTLSGLSLGTEYFVAVTEYDTDGNESWYSNEVAGVTRVMEVQNLNVAGDEHIYHLVTHDPLITFDYFDSMVETQTNYRIQISTDSTFQTNIIWDSGEVASDATSIPYTGGALLDGVKYYIRAKVASGTFWSEWDYLAFGMNTEPTMPVQISLIGDEITTSDVLLEVLNSSDAEEDNVTYDFRLYDATQGIQLDSAIAVVQDPNGTQWEVLIALDDNAQHWWTVQAYDGYEYSELAGPESFLINLENDDPAGFDLTSPLLDEAITTQSPLFTWDPAVDPDPLDTVRYVLYLETPDPGIETFYPGIDTSFQLAYDLEDNTTYHWKVVARDLNDSQTESNGGYQSFTVNTANDLPEYFELLYPVWDEMVTNLQPEFLWEASSDPDDETIVMHSRGKGKDLVADQSGSGNTVDVITGYDFYLSTDSTLTDVVPVEVIGTYYSPTEDLLENQTYYWAVSAVDDSGGVTFSDTASFWTNAQNEAPDEFSLLVPIENEVVTVPNPSFSWESTSDPDLQDGFDYYLVLGSGPDGMDTVWSGTDTTLTLGWELEDNQTYYWSVFAKDQGGLITFNIGGYQNFTVNTANDLPIAFELLYPVYNEMVTNLQPEFLWEASSDPDDEAIVLRETGKGKFTEQSSSGNNSIDVITGYNFYLGADIDLTDVIPVEVIGTSYSLATPLTENQVYYWAVSALDDSGGVTFSDTTSFWTNEQNETPVEFSLLLPEVDEVLTTLSPSFMWGSSSDPDLQDGFEYNLVLGTDPSSMDTIWTGTDTTLTLEWDLEDNTTYYWTVFAEDWGGLMTFNICGYQSFIVNIMNDLPIAFELLYPVYDEMVTNLQPEFLWEASSDPDDGEITLRGTGKGKFTEQTSSGNNSINVITGYEFYLGTEIELTDAIPVEVIGTSYAPSEDLIENMVYYWTVSALDDSGGVTFSDTVSFWTNAENEVPAEFSLLLPVMGEVLTVLNPAFTWEPSSDPDLNDGFEYNLILGTSPGDMDTVWAGSDTTLTLAWEVEDNSTYYWTVYAEDWTGLTTSNIGGVRSFTINLGNDDPSVVDLITPDSVMVLTLTPEMYWTPAFDADPNDTIAYEMQWWGDGIEYDSVLTDTNAVVLPAELADNSLYFWNVIAMDQNGGMSQSEEAFFWTNLEPEAPVGFALLSPENDVAGLSDMPVFLWESAEDPDPMDYATYTLQIATDSSFSNITFVINTNADVGHEMTEALTTDTEYWWRVIANDTDSLSTESVTFKFTVGYVAIADVVELPTEYVLQQNFPNPFNPSTTLRYGLPEDATVSLVIYDIRGNVVNTINSGTQVAGWYEHVWNGFDKSGQPVSTGLYLTRLQAGSYSKVIKMLFLK